jgi:hypothetical protein
VKRTKLCASIQLALMWPDYDAIAINRALAELAEEEMAEHLKRLRGT